MQNAPREHSAILSPFIKLQFAIKTFVLSIFEWPLKTGFTVYDQTSLPISKHFDHLIVVNFLSITLNICYVEKYEN